MKAYLPSLKANRKGRARGQTAIMEVGLAAALTAALAGTLVTSQQRYTKAQIAITAGDQHTRLAAAADLPVQPNIGSPTPGALRDWCTDHGIGAITYEVEHAALPQLVARHLPGLDALVRA